MLANLPDTSPNPNTHAYGHKDLAREERFVADMPAAPGTDLIIEHREERFIKNHERVLKKLRVMQQPEPEELELEIPDNLDEWEQVARAAAARPGVVGRLTDVIDRLVAAGRPIDDPPERAGPSGTYHPPPSSEPAGSDSSENDENVPVAATSRKRKRPRNPFILDEAEDQDDEEENEEEEDIEPDYNDVDFIDDDDD